MARASRVALNPVPPSSSVLWHLTPSLDSLHQVLTLLFFCRLSYWIGHLLPPYSSSKTSLASINSSRARTPSNTGRPCGHSRLLHPAPAQQQEQQQSTFAPVSSVATSTAPSPLQPVFPPPVPQHALEDGVSLVYIRRASGPTRSSTLPITPSQQAVFLHTPPASPSHLTLLHSNQLSTVRPTPMTSTPGTSSDTENRKRRRRVRNLPNFLLLGPELISPSRVSHATSPQSWRTLAIATTGRWLMTNHHGTCPFALDLLYVVHACTSVK
ncbi:hypothetical protein P692DRAFT_20881069 [Suillus brevipes Sb2]|nr:hypothetical protein P692DRAFT_20881069 [Suillus brevipes Sb2]